MTKNKVREARERPRKAAEPPPDRGVLNLGIDLGTSHSAISASNGQQHVIQSYVGWPIDLVARKVLKKAVLIGTEAVESRTMVDLHRPLERGLIKEGSEKDLTAVWVILEHLLALVRGPQERRRPGDARRHRRARRSDAGQQATAAQRLDRVGRRPDDRLRAVRRGLRSRRPAAQHGGRHRRRHQRLLRDARAPPHRGRPTHPDGRRRLDRRNIC